MTALYLSLCDETCDPLEKCPFFDLDRCSCSAALLTFRPEPRQLYHYCCSDDHDDCPVFLAKALRTSSSSGFARDTAAHCEK